VLGGNRVVVIASGRAAATAKFRAFEVPPTGVGLKTVTGTAAGVAISLAVMAAVNRAPLTNVVVRAVPFHRTTEDGTKFQPSSVRVKALVPATALLGIRNHSMGTGFSMVKVSGVVLPPPGVGLKTVTSAVPPVAISLAVMRAPNWALLKNNVVRSLPFQRTTEVKTKLEPSTVRGKPGQPAVALVGEMEVSVGTGFGGGGGGGVPPPPPPQPASARARSRLPAKQAAAPLKRCGCRVVPCAFTIQSAVAAVGACPDLSGTADI
jgi:hypothetical protein